MAYSLAKASQNQAIHNNQIAKKQAQKLERGHDQNIEQSRDKDQHSQRIDRQARKENVQKISNGKPLIAANNMFALMQANDSKQANNNITEKALLKNKSVKLSNHDYVANKLNLTKDLSAKAEVLEPKIQVPSAVISNEPNPKPTDLKI